MSGAPNRPISTLHLAARALGLSLLLALIWAPQATADVYHLRDGGVIEGSGQDLGDEILVEMPLGSIRIHKREIVRIVKRPSILDIYRQKLAATPQQAAARFALAAWCQQNRLSRQRRQLLLEVIALDADHPGARKALGHEHVDGRWMTQDQAHRHRGDIRFRGRWMPASAVAAILQAEAARKQLAQAKAKAAKQGQGNKTPPQGGPKAGPGPKPVKPVKPKPRPADKPLVLARSIRPSQDFLDRYFVTNGLIYGSEAARVVSGWGGVQRGPLLRASYGPIRYGPYPYDGYGRVDSSGLLYLRVHGFGYGYGYDHAGSRAHHGHRRGYGHPGGGLRFGYRWGDGDNALRGRGVIAPGHWGHSLFGRFKLGSSGRLVFRVGGGRR